MRDDFNCGGTTHIARRRSTWDGSTIRRGERLRNVGRDRAGTRRERPPMTRRSSPSASPRFRLFPIRSGIRDDIALDVSPGPV